MPSNDDERVTTSPVSQCSAKLSQLRYVAWRRQRSAPCSVRTIAAVDLLQFTKRKICVLKNSLVGVAIATLLVACGGGGSSGPEPSSPSSTTPPPTTQPPTTQPPTTEPPTNPPTTPPPTMPEPELEAPPVATV